MEKFPLGETKETTQEQKEKRQSSFKTTVLAYSMSILSTLSLFNSANAQDHEHVDTSIEKLQPIEPSEKIKEAISSQKKWLLDYVDSKKYEERFAKEYLRARQFPAESLEEFVEKQKKVILNKDGDTAYIFNPIKQYVIMRPGVDKEGTERPDLEEDTKINKVFPELDLSVLDEKELSKIRIRIKSRKRLVEQGDYMVVANIPSPDSTVETLGLYYNLLSNSPHAGKIVIKEVNKETTVPIHELTHQLTMGDIKIYDQTKYVMKSFSKDVSEYLNTPTEILARINQLRYLLNKKNIYNATSEDFTEDHIKKILGDTELMNEQVVKELLEVFTPENLLWMMNNVADARDRNNTAIMSIG